jgi:hypothetical protein
MSGVEESGWCGCDAMLTTNDEPMPCASEANFWRETVAVLLHVRVACAEFHREHREQPY